MKLTESVIEVDGITTRIFQGGHGDGTPVLFLHGWGSGAERYLKAMEYISEDSFRVALPDLPGFGKTGRPKGNWSIAEYAAWTEQLIKKLGWQRVILGGHSFGGRISIYMAAEKSEYIKSLLLYASAGVTRRNGVKNITFNVAAKLGKTIFGIPVLASISPLAKRVLYRASGSTDYLNAGEMREILKKVVSEDLTEYASKIVIPTAILWGERDSATPLEDARRLNKLIAGSSLKVIKEGSHVMHSRNPREFAGYFEELIKNLQA